MVEFTNFLLKFLDIIVWPLVVLTIVMIFKNNIRRLIDRFRSASFKGLVLGFGEVPLDEGQRPKTLESLSSEVSQSTVPRLPSDKPATLFWLANDLMWTQDMLFRNASSPSIIGGLKNLRTYVRALGLEGSLADIGLSNLIKEVESTISMGFQEWSLEYRVALARQIESIKWFLAAQAETAETGFRKLHVFPSKQSNDL